MQLAFRQQGSGRPLVVLHGIFGSSDNWLTVGKALAEHFSLYLVDQRNHGRSPRSEVFDYPSMAADLQELIEAQNLQNPLILGHSMGGKVVMEHSRLYPGVAARQVVVDIGPQFYPVHHQAILAGLNAIPLAILTSRQAAEETLAQYVPEADVRQFLLKNLYRDENGAFAWRINLPVITAQIENVGRALPATPGTKIETPTLFVRGALSRYIRQEDLPLIDELFAHWEMKDVANAGHWVQAEQPTAFLQAVLPFLLS